MGTNIKVAILMCTFNGEKYLNEQIESILNQKNVDVTLYIRDDGSTDKTNEILKEYKTKDRRVKIYKDKNIGPARGFLKLLFYVYSKKGYYYDYYSFADQDDIWFEDKLDVAVQKIENYKKPCLYCGNLIKLKDGIKEGFWFEKKPDLSFIRHIIGNNVHGCTFVFDNKLAEIIYQGGMPGKKYLTFEYHDSWVALVAIAKANIIYDHEAHILYRLHDSNEVGQRPTFSMIERKRKYGKYFPFHRVWRNAARELSKRYELSDSKKEILYKTMCYNRGIISRINFFKIIKNHYDKSLVDIFLKILLAYP